MFYLNLFLQFSLAGTLSFSYFYRSLSLSLWSSFSYFYRSLSLSLWSSRSFYNFYILVMVLRLESKVELFFRFSWMRVLTLYMILSLFFFIIVLNYVLLESRICWTSMAYTLSERALSWV